MSTVLLTELGKWVTAFFIISIFSYFLIKPTPLYKVALHSSIATALANYVVVNGHYLWNSTVIPLLNGDYIQIIPLLVGASIMLKTSRKYNWVSRPAMSVLVGVTAGLALRTIIETRIISQIHLMALPLMGGGTTPVDNLIQVLFPLIVLPVFLFSFTHKGVLGRSVKVGRLVLMVALGAVYGTGILTRISWLAAQFLILLKTFGIVQ